MKIKNLYLLVIIILSMTMVVFEFYVNTQGEIIADQTQAAWGVVFGILTVMWAILDAKENRFEKPFDFGFLLYVFWLIAFPYYLVSTRGRRGVFWAFGFYALWLAPWLSGLVAYFLFYPG